MSQRKVLFFVIIGIVLVAIVIGINAMRQKQTTTTVPSTLTIWINEGTSESYKNIIAGFKTYAPEYTKMNIVVEKKPSDAVQYRTILLNTIADGKGPDIFLAQKGEDIVLEGKIEPIPGDVIPLVDFDKKYEDIFLSLISSTGGTKNPKEYLMWVPLWYETLWVFYNKSLFRTVPKTWNELDTLYNDGMESGVFPSNLGVGPRYTPNMSQIIAFLFSWQNITSYKSMSQNGGVFTSYLYYGNAPIWSTSSGEEDIYTTQKSLANTTETMSTEKITTLDMFVRGEIGMIFWFPSIVSELEKAQKRAGTKATNDIILTERMLTDSVGKEKSKNLARFSYFAISKSSKNGIAAAKFLEYLMTEDAEQKFLAEYPYLIAAQRKFYASQASNRLSSVFARTRLDAFIPGANDALVVFDYGLKSEFDVFLDKYIDRNSIWDISNIWSSLSQAITCAVAPYTGWDLPKNCESKN